jgi:uncharacterized caspase-like protein
LVHNKAPLCDDALVDPSAEVSMFRVLQTLIFLLVGSTSTSPLWAASEKRVALVIGNGAYAHAPRLDNPVSDARDMTAALRNLGFEVIEGIDLDETSMRRTVKRFAETLTGGDVGLFFYAGHGLQVNGQNYLVPVDAKLETAAGLDFELVRLDVVHRTMEREAKTNVLFLDACRDNPLSRNLARAMGTRSSQIGKGLAVVESGVGTLISFSTQPGNVALDGAGRNSPFAGALVKHIARPTEDLSTLLIRVRNDVMAETKDRQIPWEHSSLRAKLYLAALPPEPPRITGPTYEQQAELSFWATVKDSADPAVIQTYLDRFPQGTFAALAQILIGNLKREADRKAAAIEREADLRKAEEAKKAATEAKAASDRRAAEATQASELRKAQEEAKQARLQLEAAEAARLKAEKAMLEAKKAADAAKAEREATAKEQPAAAKPATRQTNTVRPDPTKYSMQVWGSGTIPTGAPRTSQTPYGSLYCVGGSISSNIPRQCSWR